MKILIVIAMLLLSGMTVIPAEKPNCKEGESATCHQVCATTSVFCGPFAYFNEEGKFIEIPYKDCNSTTCWWNCYCIPKAVKAYD